MKFLKDAYAFKSGIIVNFSKDLMGVMEIIIVLNDKKMKNWNHCLKS